MMNIYDFNPFYAHIIQFSPIILYFGPFCLRGQNFGASVEVGIKKNDFPTIFDSFRSFSALFILV